MGHRGRSLVAAWLLLMAVMLLVAGTKTWTARAHASTCIATKDALGAICEIPVLPNGGRVHPLRAELMWAGGLAAGAGAIVLVASGRRRRAGAAEPEPV